MEAARAGTSDDVAAVTELARQAIDELRPNRGGRIWSQRESHAEPLGPVIEAAASGADPAVHLVVGTVDVVVVGTVDVVVVAGVVVVVEVATALARGTGALVATGWVVLVLAVVVVVLVNVVLVVVVVVLVGLVGLVVVVVVVDVVGLARTIATRLRFWRFTGFRNRHNGYI